ncbi:hypothetical protein ABE218_08565 [Bacillus smithii]|uniref:hypothetical protein n=1 Tax=Bacillus smithii TaxID=1479 RepID=UPI003D220ED8
MSDKERLEYIEEQVQELLTLADSEGCGEANLLAIYNDMIWLIEQAEKVEQLQRENEKEQKRLRNQIYETVEEKFLLEKQLRQAQAKIERYEKALKGIKNDIETDYTQEEIALGEMTSLLTVIYEQAQQALEGEK